MNSNPIVTVVRELNKIVIIPRDDVLILNGEHAPGTGHFNFNLTKTPEPVPAAYELLEAKIISISPSPATSLVIKLTVKKGEFSGENNLEFINGADSILLLTNTNDRKAQLCYGPKLFVSDAELHDGIADFGNFVDKELDFVKKRENSEQVEIKNFLNIYKETNLLKKIGPVNAEEIETDVIYEEEETLDEENN